MSAPTTAERRAYFVGHTNKFFGVLLGDGPNAVTHRPSRLVVEAMCEHGWLVVAVDPYGSVWASPNGERELRLIPGEPPKWMAGQRSLTYKAALAHVATHAETEGVA